MLYHKIQKREKQHRILHNWYRLRDGFGEVVIHHCHDTVSVNIMGLGWKRPVHAGNLPAWYVDCLSDLELQEYCMGLIKRTVDEKSGEFTGRPASDPELAKHHPVLVSHLCDLAYSDGEVRRTSSLLIFTEDASWKACLTDRDVDMNLWSEARTLSGLFQSLEKRLSDPSTVWRRPTRRKTR